MASPLPAFSACILSLLLLSEVSAFTAVSSPFSPRKKKQSAPKSRLFGIRCENKYYQLEELEDKENATTELFLKADGSVLLGETDGPLWSSASGTWNVKRGTDEFVMTVHKKFETGSKSRDMGEFTFTVSRTYEGDMTHVGENVAITGKMKDGILGDTKEVGFFNMIDGTDVRLDARSDARPGVAGEKVASQVGPKNDATASHKGAEGRFVGQPAGTSSNSASNLPFGWEEHYDLGQQRHYYVETTTGVTQWERPQQKPLQSALGASLSTPEPLPMGWEEHFDPGQNRKYYVDTSTGTTQWEFPSAQQAQLQQQALSAFQQSMGGNNNNALPQGWEEHMDYSQNRPYYVNTMMGTTQWERPQ